MSSEHVRGRLLELVLENENLAAHYGNRAIRHIRQPLLCDSPAASVRMASQDAAYAARYALYALALKSVLNGENTGGGVLGGA